VLPATVSPIEHADGHPLASLSLGVDAIAGKLSMTSEYSPHVNDWPANVRFVCTSQYDGKH
jgi:hypothetical protein